MFTFRVVIFEPNVTSFSKTKLQFLPSHLLVPYFTQYYINVEDVRSAEIYIDQNEEKSLNKHHSTSIPRTVGNTLNKTSKQRDISEIDEDYTLNNDLVRKSFDILQHLLHKILFQTKNL